MEPTLESGRIISTASEKCASKEVEEREGECSAMAFTRLITMHSSPQGAEVSLLVSLESGASYAWHLEPSLGLIIPPHTPPSGPKGVFKGPLVGVLSVEKKSEEGVKGDSQYILVRRIPVESLSPFNLI